jgi:hypothetical protein
MRRDKNQGQSIVEFVIALPILLFILFGLIEFARLTFAWMAVQNAARFGIRYAVTGEFDEIYCVQAGNNLGTDHINADVFGGDPQDCIVPDDYTGVNGNDKERELIDLARLFSIRDAASGGGAGLWLEPAVGGDYEQFLDTHNVSHIGLASARGFFHVTICSNRNNQYAVDYNNYSIPLCMDYINGHLMDDAGGPGDRVKVHIEHEHPIFLPILSNIWPSLNLNAERDGIVEKFRTSRVIGVSGPILSAPTWTQTPTITNTPTITPTYTPTVTSSPTFTPIPVQCDQIEIVSNFVGHYQNGYHAVMVTIRNNNPVPIHLYTANQNWVKNDPGRSLWSAKFHNSAFFNINDTNPPTSWNPSPQIAMEAGGVGDYIAVFDPQHLGLEGNTSVNLIFDDGCTKGITVNMPTSTVTLTPTITDTPTLTPTPDCSLYSASSFTFTSWAMQHLYVYNNDASSTKIVRLEFFWDYTEAYGAANGYNSLNVDWFKWRGAYMGEGQGGTRDYDSSTVWSGNLNFNAGSSNRWEIDFDNDWGAGGPLPGARNSDFGFIMDFQNGCQLVRNAVPRSIITWTPTATPTTTFTPSPPPPPTSTPLPTWTPLPTNTAPPTNTPTITWTPSITPPPTNTSVVTSTPWPSNTAPPPTWTNPPPPPPTSPPPTKTNTPDWTATPSPIPTWTPKCPPDDLNYPCQPTWTPNP